MPVIHEILNAAYKFSAVGRLKFNNRYSLYHLTNPSLSVLVNRLKPSVITVHDLIPFLPHVQGSPTDMLLNGAPDALLVRVGERSAQTEKLRAMFGLDGG